MNREITLAWCPVCKRHYPADEEHKCFRVKARIMERIDLTPPTMNFSNDVYSISQKIAAHCIDMADETIFKAIVSTAKAEGISQLFLLDKEFVMNALRKAIAEYERSEADNDQREAD